MIRKIAPIGVILMAAYGGVSPRAADLPPPVDKGASFPAETCNVLGVASCASMACHHGNGSRGSLGSEYSTWIAVDPHAKAYRALFNADSRRIHDNLARHDPEVARLGGAHKNPLCLKCHGMGDGVPPALQADGAGCERCHGPARNWKNTHYLTTFNRDTPGFNDLRNLSVRVEVCMDCHVGKGEMQVDHDLIAAGHPRLRFEFSGYYASYPRHWGKEHEARYAIEEDETLSWLLGELTAAKSALELLAFRARQSERDWPEFAEYNCVSCHQALKADSPPRRSVLPLASWYYALLPALAEARPATPTIQSQLDEALDRVRTEMGKRLPTRDRVRQDALQAAGLIEQWRDAVKGKRLAPADVKKLTALLAQQEQVADVGWDGGTQLFLSLAALRQSLDDKAALDQPLKQMRQDLMDAFPAGARSRYDTPSDYSAEKIRHALQLIRDRLE